MIPAGTYHVCSWQGRAEQVRIEHADCVAPDTAIHQPVTATGFMQHPAIIDHIQAMAATATE